MKSTYTLKELLYTKKEREDLATKMFLESAGKCMKSAYNEDWENYFNHKGRPVTPKFYGKFGYTS
jgi:hypothetical protein